VNGVLAIRRHVQQNIKTVRNFSSQLQWPCQALYCGVQNRLKLYFGHQWHWQT